MGMAESVIVSDNGPDSDVIAGVMEGVRQSFIDSGVDMAVLAKLEQLWVSKLSSAGSPGVAIADVMVPGAVPKRKERKIGAKKAAPASMLNLKTIDDFGQIVTDSDPDDSGSGTSEIPLTSEIITKVSKAKEKKRKRARILQVDGPADSSDEEDAVDDDDDDIDPDGEDDEGVEEEPLGSEDDISDDDASDLFETDNVVVCQYDKITRARNKWKFHLKDGIMNLNGKDYVFQRAHGDAEW